jgi:hypothetical protein
MSEDYKEYEAAAGDSKPVAEKKTSPWVWVAVGCGGLAVLVVLAVVAVMGLGLFVAKDFVEDMGDNPARAMAEMAIRQDPDMEIVDQDEGTFTVRNSRTGEEVTINFEDIAEGKLSFTTEEGDVTVEASGDEEQGGVTITGPEGDMRIGADASADDVPGWVPLFPDAKETMGNFHVESEEGTNGIVSQLTEAGVEDVLDWFQEWFEENGFESGNRMISTGGGGSFGSLSGEHPGEGRGLSLTVAVTDEGTAITLTYTEGG